MFKKDKKRFYELELFELETKRKREFWFQRYFRSMLILDGALIVISFAIIKSWFLMDLACFGAVISIIAFFISDNDTHWIDYYIYQKKKESSFK